MTSPRHPMLRATSNGPASPFPLTLHGKTVSIKLNSTRYSSSPRPPPACLVTPDDTARVARGGGQLPYTTSSNHFQLPASTLPEWTEHISSAHPPASPVITDGTERRAPGATGPIQQEDWELRTQSACLDDDKDPDIAALKVAHAKQLAHYKTLLIRAQSASSSSIHGLHTQLHELDARYTFLQAEHDRCARERTIDSQSAIMQGEFAAGVRSGHEVNELVRDLHKAERIALLGNIVEACNPSDIDAQIALLERNKRSKLDILGRLVPTVATKVLSFLEVTDILNLRMVTRRHADATRSPQLWRTLCRRLEWRDWDAEAGLAHLDGIADEHWERMYQRLWRRELNWASGHARRVYCLNGHTNFVTSLTLRGHTLISGSYDESVRLWDLCEPLAPPTILPVKAVSCLAFLPPANVFVVGTHDTGRVQVWHKVDDQWLVKHTLAGHLHGIRAVAINDTWLVSAGADKALVVWDWRTGEKVVRFGQQTNICVGVQLIQDYIVAITVDGIIRAFSVIKRNMIAQYRINELAGSDSILKPKLRSVGGGTGGTGMINWFQGGGKHLNYATKDTIIRLEWEETAERYQPAPTKAGIPSPASVTRVSTTSSSARAAGSPASKTPVRKQSSLGLGRGAQVNSPDVNSPARRSPLSTRSISNHLPSPAHTASTTPRKPPIPSRRSSTAPFPETDSATDAETRFIPVFSQAPKVVEVLDALDVERGAMDASRRRLVTSTRFAVRKGAERQLYVSAPASQGTTAMIPIAGAWKEQAGEMKLQTPEKNPMSLALDRDKLVYGCTDGTIVVVRFDEE